MKMIAKVAIFDKGSLHEFHLYKNEGEFIWQKHGETEQKPSPKKIMEKKGNKQDDGEALKDFKDLSSLKDLKSLSNLNSLNYSSLTEYFYSKICEFTDRVKPPNYKVWSNDFRKLLEIDKREEEHVRRIINFVTSDPFWQINILSPKKLREKFDMLAVQCEAKERSHEKNQQFKPSNGKAFQYGNDTKPHRKPERTGWLKSNRKDV